MPVKIHTDFISDLVQVGNSDLAGRALRKCFDGGGRFIEQSKEDHRYTTIKDAWIRKISKGMRIIYVKSGADVLLYRAGEHSVEDDLHAPRPVEAVLVEGGRIEEAMEASFGRARKDYARAVEDLDLSDDEVRAHDVRVGASRLLYNHGERFLYSNLLGRRYLPHKDVYLVSPYLSHSLLRSTHVFGQMLDELKEAGATIWLVTLPPRTVDDLQPFLELEARGFNVFFNDSVHAKVYAFVLNRDQLKPNQMRSEDFVAVGSANLTRSGINPNGLLKKNVQYEITYQSHPADWSDIERFVLHVTELGTELGTLRATLTA